MRKWGAGDGWHTTPASRSKEVEGRTPQSGDSLGDGREHKASSPFDVWTVKHMKTLWNLQNGCQK